MTRSKAKQKTISILGCGWLGQPLGARLAQRGYRVNGATTSPEKLLRLAEAGITSYHLTLDPWVRGEQVRDFFRADVLVLLIPPQPQRPDVDTYFGEQIQAVIDELHYGAVYFVVFASCTSVYARMNGPVIEGDAGRPRPWSLEGRALLDAERRLMRDAHFDTTVLRFADFYGYDRQVGRGEAQHGGTPLNLVHRDDAVAVVEAVIAQDARHEILNVCADAHSTRQAFAARAAQRLGLEPPAFDDDAADAFCLVSNQRLKARLGYRFLHPDPLADAP